MPTFSKRELELEVASIVGAMGASFDDAAWIAHLLVCSNLRGHDSHGVIRIPQYFEACKRGQIQPRARPEVATEGATTAQVNGHKAFGQVTGRFAAEIAVAKALRSGGTLRRPGGAILH
ncbi:MAG: Ldh family oxidoreductase [bacterium]